MAETQAAITAEVKNILEDVLFIRAPIQTRLLKYLHEQTSNGGPPPTQSDVAIKGLGRNPDFDNDSDSYARVQVSRLRHNLDNYYARYRPVAEHRIVIKPGTYLLALQSETPKENGGAFSEISRPREARDNRASGERYDPSIQPSVLNSGPLNFAFGFVAAIVLILLVLLAAQFAIPVATA